MTACILLVDDDADIRSTMGFALQSEGHTVRLAANGLEALEVLDALASAERPRVILLDLTMPLMNGFEFRKAQLARADLASIPVLILSGDGNVAKKATTLGSVGYLQKPVDLGELLQTVERYCPCAA